MKSAASAAPPPRAPLRRFAPTLVTALAVAFVAVRFAKGRTVSLHEQVGHPVLLNFWATWCPPCVDEVPSLEDLARRIEGTDLRMLAVSVDDEWATIRRFFAQGSKIGVLLDASHNVPKTFGTEKYPETFLLDAAGRVRYYFINKRDWSRPEAVACLESLR
jgi:cytochrome c biogenesis protein CcmG/thiol:disulfide interchange protein DsbE